MPLCQNKSLYSGLPLLVFFLLSLFFWLSVFLQGDVIPPVWPDEVLFFSPASQLAHTGKMATDVLIGLIPGMESKTLWMPPVYIVISSIAQLFFSSTLTTVRLLSAFSIHLSALAFTFFLYRFNFNKLSLTLAFATIICEPLLFRFGIPARMEGVTILLFMVSLLFAQSQLNFQTKSSLAGFFLSLSALAHPFTISLGFTVLYLLTREKENRFRSIFYFLIGGVTPLLFWVYYIYPDWNLFLIQFGAQLIRKKTLFASFDLITKLKIFLFGFAFSKVRLMIILVQLGTFFYLSLQFLKTNARLSHRFIFFWIWILSVMLSIYSSSEGWYVIHFLFPFAFGMAILSEQEYFGRILALVGVFFSMLGWFQIIHLHWIKTNSEQLLNNQFSNVYNSVKSYDKIYIQSIPDPYFFLKEKNPNQEILEFIPGELMIPSNTFRQTIAEQEAFIFYNEDLKNQAIIDFLNTHPEWIREEWEIPVTKEHWLAFKTIIYRKPLETKL